ncbi:MAG: hypothetical protein JO222_13275, partial [Frankiales bacterium]|nr:hypothetical protein [Frankiales bacterium]
MRRLAMTLPALATVAVTLAGCGGSSSTPTTPIGGSSSSTPPAGSQSAPAGGGNAPANPTAAKAEITHNWETFLSSNTSHAVAASLLQ